MVLRLIATTLMVLVAAGPALAGDLSDRVEASRMTVLEVNKSTHQVRCIKHNWMAVASTATVIGHDGRKIGLGGLAAGDVIKVESKDGEVQKIVVLRTAADETAGSER